MMAVTRLAAMSRSLSIQRLVLAVVEVEVARRMIFDLCIAAGIAVDAIRRPLVSDAGSGAPAGSASSAANSLGDKTRASFMTIS